jgi:hypothetical protein
VASLIGLTRPAVGEWKAAAQQGAFGNPGGTSLPRTLLLLNKSAAPPWAGGKCNDRAAPRPCLQTHGPTTNSAPTCGVPTSGYRTGLNLKARLCSGSGRGTLDRSRAGQTSTVSDPPRFADLLTLSLSVLSRSGRPLTGPVSFVVRCHRWSRVTNEPCIG